MTDKTFNQIATYTNPIGLLCEQLLNLFVYLYDLFNKNK